MRHSLPALVTLGVAFTASFGVLDAQTAPPVPAAAAAPSGDAVKGRANFLGYGCYECHGTQGQGNYAAAPHIAPHPIPFAALIAYIRRPAGEMPSYDASILPDKDVADIYAYLSSVPAAKPASADPALTVVTVKPK